MTTYAARGWSLVCARGGGLRIGGKRRLSGRPSSTAKNPEQNCGESQRDPQLYELEVGLDLVIFGHWQRVSFQNYLVCGAVLYFVFMDYPARYSIQ